MEKLKVICKYTQSGSSDGAFPIYYTVEFEADTYMNALKYLTNVAETCNGIITYSSIEKIETCHNLQTQHSK